MAGHPRHLLPGRNGSGKVPSMLKVAIRTILALPLLAILIVGASTGVRAENRFITLASTTSTVASGLYDRILPIFTKHSGIAVHVVAVGTGQALRLSRNGDADALLVHHPPSEEAFVAAGFGIDRRAVMYNQFLIVGPAADPAGAGAADSASETLRRIATTGAPFISRADSSGTHKKELDLWRRAKIDPKPGSGTWYMETGSGMGATLRMAVAMKGYTLTDRGTWLSYRHRGGLRAIFDRTDTGLRNQYSVILVNPARHPHVKAALARSFMDWLTAPAGQAAIAAVTVGGETLFIPNAKQAK
ncbi:MAG: substrate-binding domain-containing protein [Alphaproteobacteria bacterium]|nr:substrate-binding domain-containing protein [Alphaproteobacteria bacterium]